MHSLSEILQAPDPLHMERFFERLPIIFNVVLFSVHGYFGQADVLGLPDTGGQVGTSPWPNNVFACKFSSYFSLTGGLCVGSSGCNGGRVTFEN